MTLTQSTDLWEVMVCPKCGATSVNNDGRAGQWWSRAGDCHIGADRLPSVRYLPLSESCHEDIGSDPCGKPAVAARVDPNHGSFYPVCKEHDRA